MNWLRRGFVGFLSLLLFISLLGGALATSADLNLTKPAKIEAWLNQSRLYDHFITGIIDQADKSNDSGPSDSVSLSDAAVQKAARSAFSPQVLQQNVNVFLESNYAWLEGKTAIPDFKIDLTSAKQDFAKQVGQYVRIYTAGLPVCTPAQALALQTQPVDPLLAACRPAGLTPEAAGTAVTQKLAGSGDFLSNPVITADTLNPDTASRQPYYQKLSRLPEAYRLAIKLPIIFAVLAAVSSLAIVFMAPRKRAGLRRVTIILLVSGMILAAIKVVADFGFQQIEQRVFNAANTGPLQQSLTDFAHRVESALVKVDLLFGIAFLGLAAILFIILFRTRSQDTVAKDILNQDNGPLSPLPKPTIETPASPVPRSKKPRSPRPPRLVQ